MLAAFITALYLAHLDLVLVLLDSQCYFFRGQGCYVLSANAALTLSTIFLRRIVAQLENSDLILW